MSTKKYNIDMLVYYETTNSIESAIQREKQLKIETNGQSIT